MEKGSLRTKSSQISKLENFGNKFKQKHRDALQLKQKLEEKNELIDDLIIPSSNEEILPVSEHSEIMSDSESDTSTPINKKQLKSKVRMLNQELSQFAQKKQLHLARRRIEWAKKRLLPLDVHSFTNLLNVYVRCGDMPGARAVLTEMREFGSPPNAITITALMKGCCESGNLLEAFELLSRDIPSLLPPSTSNSSILQRTMNTFLRGCVRVGAIDLALKGVRTFQKTYCPSLSPEIGSPPSSEGLDGVGVEYLLSLLCQGGREASATALLASSLHSPSSPTSSPLSSSSGYLALARLYLLLGMDDEARKWNGCAVELLQNEKSRELREKMKTESTKPLTLPKGQGLEPAKDVSTSRDSDPKLDLFLQHRREELGREAEDISDFIGAVHTRLFFQQRQLSLSLKTSISSSDQPPLPSSLPSDLQRRLLVCDTLSRLLYFGIDGKGDQFPDNPPETSLTFSPPPLFQVQNFLTSALDQKYGLKHFVSPSTSNSAHSQLFSILRERIMEKIQLLFSPEFTVDFKLLFSPLSSPKSLPNLLSSPLSPNSLHYSHQSHSSTTSSNKRTSCSPTAHPSSIKSLISPNLSIKVEICSGSGDWVVNQAMWDMTYEKKPSSSSSSRGWANDAGWSFEPHEGSPHLLKSSSLWVGMELRADRVYDIMTKSILASQMLQDQFEKQNELDNRRKREAKQREDERKEKDRKEKDRRDASLLSIVSGQKQVSRFKLMEKEKAKSKSSDQGKELTGLLYQMRSESRTPSSDSKLPQKRMKVEDEETRRAREGLEMYGIVMSDEEEEEEQENEQTDSHTPLPTDANSQVLCPFSLSNLALVGGDASQVLPAHFPPDCLSWVYVNYPEPPERTSGVGSSQGRHLLTRDFFLSLHRVLKKQKGALGKLTILSDNQPYLLSLFQDLVEMGKESLKEASSNPEGRVPVIAFQAAYVTADEYLVECETYFSEESSGPCVRLWRGQPGEDLGYRPRWMKSEETEDKGASYFDRMWSKGKKKRRWFLHLEPLIM